MITPSVTTEHGNLRAVIMCMANPFDIDLDAPPADLMDEVSLSQLERHPLRPYDFERVHTQQKALAAVIEANGAQVLWAEPLGGCVTQHYTRDVGVTVGGLTIVTRPRRAYRRREIVGLEPVLTQIDTVRRIKTGFLEGGDVLVDRDTVIIGLGEETDMAGIAEMDRILTEEGVDMAIKPLSFTHRGVIHTDTLFNIVGEGVALIHRPSITAEDIKWLETRFDLIDATEDEARDLQINTLAIGGGKVVMLAPGGRLADEVAKRGLEPVLINYSEVIALPGSFRCTSQPIVRD